MALALVTLDPDSAQAERRRIGAGLRALRLRQGLTQADLAARLHTSTATVRAYEQGRYQLAVLSLRPWADALGVTRAELVAAIGLLEEPSPEVWWARPILEQAGLPPDEIDRHERELSDQPLANQRAVVDHAVLPDWRRRQRRMSAEPADEANCG